MLATAVLMASACSGVRVPTPASTIPDTYNPGVKPAQTHVSYGPDANQYFDYYKARAPGLRPTIIWVHGGGWTRGTTVVPPQMLREVLRGYSLISVQYRLAPAKKFPAAVTDVQDALRYVKTHASSYGIDVNAIMVAGHSAGGNLAASVATMWNTPGYHGGADVRPASWASFSGPLDMAYFVAHASWFDPAVYLAPSQYRAASPLYNLDAGDPPGFMVYGTTDNVVPEGRQHYDMADKYKAFNRPNDLWFQEISLPGCNWHGTLCGVNWPKFDQFADTTTRHLPLPSS